MVSSVAKRVRQLENKIAPPDGRYHTITVPSDVTDTSEFVRQEVEDRGLDVAPEDNFVMVYLVKPDGKKAPRFTDQAGGGRPIEVFTNVQRVLEN